MSSKDKNLSSTKKSAYTIKDKKVGIVTSKWNDDITFSLEKACIKTLKAHGLEKDNLHVIKVPGSFELPYGAKFLLGKHKLDSVICLGCVIKGETKHDEYINHAVATGLTSLSIMSSKPVIFGVLTPNTKEQALDRAGGKYGNKGDEAAITAIEMMCLAQDSDHQEKKIGF